MAFEEENQGFFGRFGTLFKVIGVLLAVALGLGAFYVMTLFQPQAGEIDPDKIVSKEDPQMVELLNDSRRLEEEFMTAASAQMVADDALDKLRQAIEKQKEYNDLLGSYDAVSADRLSRLQQLLQDTLGERYYDDSARIELTAVQQEESGNYEEALASYQEALRLQRMVNNDFPLSKARNVSREARLERQVERLRARPDYERSVAAEQAAEAAIEADDWKTVHEKLDEAIEAQRKINLQFRDSQYYSTGRLEYLQERQASLASSNLFVQIDEAEKKAQAFEESKDYRAAAEQYQIAQRVQERLNQEYPLSVHASVEKEENFSRLRERALSQELADGILTQMTEIDTQLRNREVFKAAEQIPSLYRKAERFRENFPRSQAITDQQMLKLQFLNFIQQDMEALQERVYASLIPTIDFPEVHVARTEVPQALFEMLMAQNPSRERGPTLPVDSVSYREAEEFTRRLGYLLGREARLPSRDEFRSAIGRITYLDLNAVAWHAGNSDLTTHPVGEKEPNPQGFLDVLGNVEEWVTPETILDSEEALVAGGSALTPLDTLADVPFRTVNKGERSRTTGFRYAVILPSE